MRILKGEHDITFEYNNISHKGVDLSHSTNEEENQVYPNCKGVVVYLEDGLGNMEGYSGWGNYILIKHPNGMYSRYAHLQKGLLVKEGQMVDESNVIAFLGNSGYAFGRHLHFEVQTGASSNTRIDPTPYLEKSIWEEKSIENVYYKVINGALWLLDEFGNKIKTYPNDTIVKYISDGYDKYGYHYYFIEVETDGKVGYMANSYLKQINKLENPPILEESFENEINVGDYVIPINLISYDGVTLKQFDPKYQVTELEGDRAVLKALKNGELVTWSAMNIKDIKKI